MVESCIVQFCTDSNKTEYTMHRFPNDANLKRQLVNFVQVKKKDFYCIPIVLLLYWIFMSDTNKSYSKLNTRLSFRNGNIAVNMFSTVLVRIPSVNPTRLIC